MPVPQPELTLRLKGMEKLLRTVRDPRLLGPHVERGLRQSGAAVQREAAKRAPSGADGRLKGSIAVEVDRRRPLPLWAKVGPQVKYGRWVEMGTRPHFPPPSALVRWARLKLRARNPESAAFAIARKIAKHGTKAQPYMAPGLDAAKSTIARVWQEVGKRIGHDFGRRTD